MWRYAVISLITAILAAVAGFPGFAAARGNPVWLFCAVFIVIAVVNVLRWRR
jgi:uncharacterized membrane protein YtjA (UPF0391 family)